MIHVTALVVKHANPKMLFFGAIDSAPKHLEAYGKVNGTSIFLGSAEFDPLKNSVHVIELEENKFPAVDRIVWKIKDNWGNPNWTCVYRLAVHGKE